MSAPISVIIPTLDEADRLGPCLRALYDGLAAGLVRELIIADGGSDDGIEALADELGARLVHSPRGRGHQLAAGAAVARGSWLLVLHPASVPGPGWIEAVGSHIRSRPGKAGWFRLRFDTPGLMPALVAGWANWRSRVFGLPMGDQGLLVPRGLYERAGGYPEAARFEDVSLARALSGQLVAIDAEVTAAAQPHLDQGWWTRGARNWAGLLRHGLGARAARRPGSGLARDGRNG
ncbi:glycosyltransferase [Paroceanicella profunda]|uniref:Glycosyltransferase n=1 Tax=Paroceanicella profunda TaxID=2579971 RepID=A0A5B8FU42_9RHOB|nr:glycosyltransferase [Paroceanicella profunda]QDL91905.1 glycosyltransferase [Paroceanicella profunda]